MTRVEDPGETTEPDSIEEEAPPSKLERARLRIVHLNLGDPKDLERALDRAVKVSSSTLDVARVGIWLFGEDRRSISLLRGIDETSPRSSFAPERGELQLDAYPAYRAAIDERRVIAADDARTDARTRELTATYLDEHGITSMLDAPIFIGGCVWGIVCHEHVGPPRTWTAREVDFAVSVADMLSALFEQSSRLGLEKELHARDVATVKHEKVELLMRLGAGVAHDFNTILQTISLFAERIAQQGAADEQLTTGIIDECRMGARIVRQLLVFARPSATTIVPIDLGVILDGMRAALESSLGEGLRLELEPFAETRVLADRAQIEQVIINLVANARDATRDGGSVVVSVVADGAFARFSVRDEGEGMDDEVRRRVFEPFFTTKKDRGGTGLGLATVAAIVERWGGSVDVRSAPGVGTTVSVTLPLAG